VSVCVVMSAGRGSSSSSVPVSHLANVEALVERAAAEAATRCGAGEMERRSSLPPSYAASTTQVRRRGLLLK